MVLRKLALTLLVVLICGHVYGQGTSPNGFVPVYCTWSADWSAHDAGWNLSFAPGNHDAVNWWTSVQNSGHVSSPRSGTLMVMSYPSPTGHVGWVSSASGNSFVLYHSNWPVGQGRHSSNCTFDPGSGQVSIAGGSLHPILGFLTRPPDNPPISPPGAPYPGSGLHVQYNAYVEDVGWQGWVQDGAMAGTEQQSKRMEAISVVASGVGLYYQAHVEEYGWQGWHRNGEVAGTTGCAHRMEAIRITTDPGYSVSYQAQVQDVGWQGWVSDGATAGTEGQGKRLEALRITIVALDSTPPTINLTPPSIGGWYTTNQNVSWSVTDNRDVSQVKTWWNSESQTGVGVTGNTPMREGANTFHVWARDSVGNASQVDRIYRLDMVPPAIVPTVPATGVWLNGSPTVSWSISDTNSGFGAATLKWNGGTATSIGVSGSTAIPEGKTTAYFHASDVAGNASDQSRGEFWVDKTAPTTSAGLSPAAPNGENGWYTTIPVVTLSASDSVPGVETSGVATMYYSIDGGPAIPCSGAFPVTGDGSHAVSYWSADVAGNVEVSKSFGMKVDTSLPDITGITVPDQSGSMDTLAASWAADDPQSGMQEYWYAIGTTAGDDDLVPATSTGLTPYGCATGLTLEIGHTYYFTVWAKNGAGLISMATSNGTTIVSASRDVTPLMDSGGVSSGVDPDVRRSTNYAIVDSIGQFVVGVSESANYKIEHGYWHSDVNVELAPTINVAKGMPDGKTIQLAMADSPVVVTVDTGAFGGRFYVEQWDRFSGMAVEYSLSGGPSLVEGDRIWLVGKTGTSGGERIITEAQPYYVGHDDLLPPLAMINRSLGGGPFGLQDGVWNWVQTLRGYKWLQSRDMNNIGVLVTTWGRVTAIGEGYLYVDDGSCLDDGTQTAGIENIGVRVICDPADYDTGDYLIVTGISSCFETPSGLARRILTRRPEDIRKLFP